MMDVYRKIGLLMAEAAEKTEGPVVVKPTTMGDDSMVTVTSKANEKLRKAREDAEAAKQADPKRRGTTTKKFRAK